MAVQVLLSTMNQVDLSIVDKCKIKSDCLIINQCDQDDVLIQTFDFGIVKMISTKERGLSKSRNLALRESDDAICLLCDDDIIYRGGYEKIVEEAFKELPDADIIVFNIHCLDDEKRPQEQLFRSVKRISKFKAYSSVHIAFRRDSILSASIFFNEKFGAGSGMYSMAEDSLFFDAVHKKKLKAYTYPAVIADLKVEGSSWFTGFNEKYFFDTGAYLAAAYPLLKYVFCYYYPIRLRNSSLLSFFESLRWIYKGIKGYGQGISYDEYRGLEHGSN